MRIQKAVERAEVVFEQTEKKVERSKRRGKTVRDRRVSLSLSGLTGAYGLGCLG